MTKGELSKKKIIEAAGDLFWKNGYTIADVQTVNGDDTFNDTYMIYERVHTKPRV